MLEYKSTFGEVLKWSKRRDSKSRRTLTCCVASNPTFSARKRLKIGYNLEAFSPKSACVGINPQKWMKSLRDEICLTAG